MMTVIRHIIMEGFMWPLAPQNVSNQRLETKGFYD